METRFRKGQKVRIKFPPSVDDIEPYPDPDENPDIKPGMEGKVNIILPNGRYHIKILNKEGETIAYAAMDEELLEEY